MLSFPTSASSWVGAARTLEGRSEGGNLLPCERFPPSKKTGEFRAKALMWPAKAQWKKGREEKEENFAQSREVGPQRRGVREKRE
jgi:hypothetical protein